MFSLWLLLLIKLFTCKRRTRIQTVMTGCANASRRCNNTVRRGARRRGVALRWLIAPKFYSLLNIQTEIMTLPYIQVYFLVKQLEISIPIIESDFTQLIDVWKIYFHVWCRVQIILKCGVINQIVWLYYKLISLHVPFLIFLVLTQYENNFIR